MEPSRRQVSRSSSRYSRHQKPWQEKCKDGLRNVVAFMFTNVGIVGLVIGYTTGGAFMFQSIEQGVTQDSYNYALKNRSKAVEDLWQLTDKQNVLSPSAWHVDVEQILKDYQKWFVSHTTQKGADVSQQKWSFPGAFLYSLTVITTIGYGNLSPRTDGGKLATVVYAIIGMPLFLLYLSNIGDILARCFKWGYFKMCLCRGCPGTSSFRRRRNVQQDIPMSRVLSQNEHNSPQRKFQVRRVEEGVRGSRRSSPDSEDSDNSDSEQAESEASEEEEEEEEEESETDKYDPQSVTVPITLCLAFMVWYVLVGAWLFHFWEDWGPLDGSYFCFISLSTIGFGDIVPGDKIYNHDSRYLSFNFIATAVYLMLGMALIAMCFNLMQEEVIHKTRTCITACTNIFSCFRRR